MGAEFTRGEMCTRGWGQCLQGGICTETCVCVGGGSSVYEGNGVDKEEAGCVYGLEQQSVQGERQWCLWEGEEVCAGEKRQYVWGQCVQGEGNVYGEDSVCRIRRGQ